MSAPTPGQAAREALEGEVRALARDLTPCAGDKTCASCDREVTSLAAPVMELADAYAAAGAYPRQDGDVTVIGPQCFASLDGSVINWRGVNYVPQPDPGVHPIRGESGWLDVTCGACGAQFAASGPVADIACTECEARRCPACGHWHGGGQ